MSVQHRANNFEFLNMQQSRGAIDFHRGSLTWMHNVIHWPTFYNECEKFWNRETVEEKSWLALYYAVLSTLMIHQRFFLKSLKDRWYTYTRITCIESARTILEEYYASFKDESSDMWTILAHVTTASIILLLDYLLSEDSVPSNYQLVCDCLSLMERSEKHSTIHAKGTRLIRILSSHAQQKSPPDLSQIALMLRDGEASNEQAELQSMGNGHNAGAEMWDWDSVFFNSFDMTFDGTFL
ncbi:hypothetical protein IFR04_001853 [Cadophora malorum]|uniref:Uncharacterized protein n=1 Tax=Cadophora malorum TaxID=108018 RepID=A0A8H7WHJ6_9HELO|nr:hypothetical protein IFR04_001853 [Cadophora malorum]